MIVRLEDVVEHVKFARKVESVPLKDIVFTLGGEPVDVDKTEIEEFEFTGLSNMLFVQSMLIHC